MKNLSKLFLVGMLGYLLVSTVNVSAVCTEWYTYRIEDNCDRSSGICAWNNWGNSNMRTAYKRKSCTNYKGQQWFEYTQSTYQNGCC